jgi:hypothetical protein
LKVQAKAFKTAKEQAVNATEGVIGTFTTSASDAVSDQSFTAAYGAAI